MTAPTPRERVAVITTSFPRSEGDAAGHFVLAEVRALQQAGTEVVVIAGGSSDYAPSGCDVRFVGGSAVFDWPGALARLRQNPLRLAAAALFVRRARRELERSGPFDRIVAHWLVPSAFPVATGPFAHFAFTKLDVVVHGSDARLLARFPSLLRNTILSALAARGARLRFVSSALRTALCALDLPRDVRSWLERSSFVEPAAIEVPPSLDRNSARAALDLPEDVRLLVICGRLVETKRSEVALGAADLVPDASVVIIGSGPLETQLASRFPEARFLGQLPRHDALTWMAAADVLVSASLEEGAPTVVREALTLGTLVVARDCGDLALWAESNPDLFVV